MAKIFGYIHVIKFFYQGIPIYISLFILCIKLFTFRGLFEKDKLVFSFMLCIEIMRNAGDITLAEWNFFLRGASGLDKQRPVKPSVPWISRHVWNQAYDLSDCVPAFKGIYQDLTKTPCWIKLGENLVWYEPCHEKTCLRSFRPGETQTCLLSYRS